MKPTRFFGAHVSSSGGLENALKNGQELGVNTIQLHPSPPQKWNSKAFAPGAEDKFLEMREQSGIARVFFHGIYLINLANPDAAKQHAARQSLVNYLDLCARIGAAGVIFHVGSMNNEPSEELGLARAAESINKILDEAKNPARLILEVAAGSGQVIGDRMEELATIYHKVEDKSRVGFGLDSQHMWASGYDLRNDLEQIVSDMERIFTLDKVWSVHLNDSKTELGSRKDRHENLGDGLIGKDALLAFLNHPKLRSIPYILETPALKDLESAKAEVEKLRTWVAT